MTELLQQIVELRSKLFADKLSYRTSNEVKPHQIKQTRREIARLLTQLNKA